MSGFINFVCADGNLTVKKEDIAPKLLLFQNNPDLAKARTYELRCRPRLATLTQLLPRISDSSEELIITDDNFTELQNLVRELGFSGLDSDLKAFSASQAGSTTKQQIGELTERVDDHDVQIYGVDTRLEDLIKRVQRLESLEAKCTSLERLVCDQQKLNSELQDKVARYERLFENIQQQLDNNRPDASVMREITSLTKNRRSVKGVGTENITSHRKSDREAQ